MTMPSTTEVAGEEGDEYRAHAVPPTATSPADIGAGSFALAAEVRRRLGDRRVWHVNSTSTGGGVAEMLHSSMARHRELGLDVTWLVSNAPPDFFTLTKRIHHGLHGRLPGGRFTPADVELYRTATARQATALLRHVRPGDVVVLHDPQTLGAAPALVERGVRVAWRSHIGTLRRTAETAATWALLVPYLDRVRHCVFTMAEYAPPSLPPERLHVIRPSIDPATPKNVELPATTIHELLARIGLNGAPSPAAGGSTQHEAPLGDDTPVLLQVSRWDPLKDMAGVLRAFAAHVAPETEAHLVLAGPDPADIPDDPEGRIVFDEMQREVAALPAATRRRVHLVVLSLRDAERNGLLVNALQRRATVVAQKSLEEGFGLTITEAMWKAKPVVATRVGGITAQITSPAIGVLVDDPTDLRAFGRAIAGLFHDPARAAMIGAAGRRHCAAEFLCGRELDDYLRLYLSMLDA